MQKPVELGNASAVNLVILYHEGSQANLLLKPLKYTAKVTATEAIAVEINPL
jgi:hypothetical protein